MLNTRQPLTEVLQSVMFRKLTNQNLGLQVQGGDRCSEFMCRIGNKLFLFGLCVLDPFK